MNTYALVPVTATTQAEQNVLCNLTKMYCCEWSQYTGMDVDEQGQYIFEKYLPTYWSREDRRAFLLRCTPENGQPHWAGFALMDRDFCRHPDYDHSLAEFFVLPKYRKQGAGRWMATALFDRFPGLWELGRNPKNITAYAFWENLIRDYTCGQYELVCAAPEHQYLDGTLGDVFAFHTGV